ncbi:PIN domain-containing protein [Candidatus Peregrinibacteria bacterium]|nr:PIN domain-containing protein [Candidatus Peregrinibacteria bacterium]
MDNILIDTDVILDFFFDRLPFSESATQIISLCESKRINGFVTPVICNNSYYLLRQTAQHNKVIEKLRQLITFMDILVMDKDVVLQALSSGFKDFEDALQNFAAIKSGNIDVIVTRNTKDYIKSKIGVMTPENYVKSIAACR